MHSLQADPVRRAIHLGRSVGRQRNALIQNDAEFRSFVNLGLITLSELLAKETGTRTYNAAYHGSLSSPR